MAPGVTAADSDHEYQDAVLPGVSRTFALTIPQLPEPLRRVVSNGYLLCRIADTIEDDPDLDAQRKQHYHERFIEVVGRNDSAEDFAAELGSLLSPRIPEAERALVANTPRVIRVTHSFTPRQQAALLRCVRIMSQGMAEFERNRSISGLPDLAAMDSYCYHVAGVVGELLTELFCDYHPDIEAHRSRLWPLAVSFGQGLQMTNILKDMWDDRRQGACWLPRSVCEEYGVELQGLTPGRHTQALGDALEQLIGIAHHHLRNALEYTLLIPASEAGIRRFCLWALGLAVLTLRKINRHRDYTSGQEVKVSRRSVKATIVMTHMFGRSDAALRCLFAVSTYGLPRAEVQDESVHHRLS